MDSEEDDILGSYVSNRDRRSRKSSSTKTNNKKKKNDEVQEREDSDLGSKRESIKRKKRRSSTTSAASLKSTKSTMSSSEDEMETGQKPGVEYKETVMCRQEVGIAQPFSLSATIQETSYRFLWNCLLSKRFGSFSENVTGVGFRHLQRTEPLSSSSLQLIDPRAVLKVKVVGSELSQHFGGIHNPVVRVSIVDSSTGEYLSKRKASTNEDAVYSGEMSSRVHVARGNCNTLHLTRETERCRRIPPQITGYGTNETFGSSETQQLSWAEDEPLVFNVFMKNLLQPDAVLFFEILDCDPSADIRLLRRGNGFRQIAWAYLKLLNANGAPNIESELGNSLQAIRLQLYHFPPDNWLHRAVEELFGREVRSGTGPKVFNAFRFKKRRRVASSLNVIAVACPKPEATSTDARPLHAMQTESRNVKSVSDLLNGKHVNRAVVRTPAQRDDEEESSMSLVAARRHRMRTEPCLVPRALAARLEAGKNGCFDVKFSPDGEFLAAACQDGPSSFSIKVFVLPKLTQILNLTGHQALIYELAWVASNESTWFLASASGDGTARVWKLSRGSCLSGGDKENNAKRPLHILRHAPPKFVYSVAFHPLEKKVPLLFSGAFDGFIRLWDIQTGNLLGKLEDGRNHHASHVNTLCFTADGNRLVSGDGSGIVSIWRLETGRKPKEHGAWRLARKIEDPDLRGKAITSVDVHPVEQLLLVAAQQNVIRLFELRRYTKIHEGFIGAPVSRSFVRAKFSPDGRYVVSGGEDGKPHVWKTQSGLVVEEKSWHFGFPKPLCSLSWHPNEHLVAFCSFNTNSPVLLFEASRENRDVDAKPVNALVNFTATDEGVDEPEMNANTPESQADRCMKTTKVSIMQRLSASLSAIGLSDDEDENERKESDDGGDEQMSETGKRQIETLRQRLVHRRLKQQQQQRDVTTTTNQKECSDDDDDEEEEEEDNHEVMNHDSSDDDSL